MACNPFIGAPACSLGQLGKADRLIKVESTSCLIPQGLNRIIAVYRIECTGARYSGKLNGATVTHLVIDTPELPPVPGAKLHAALQ
jgi:hypothetical protein